MCTNQQNLKTYKAKIDIYKVKLKSIYSPSEELNTSLSELIYQEEKEIRKNTDVVINTIAKIDVTHIHRLLHCTTEEHIFFSSTFGQFKNMKPSFKFQTITDKKAIFFI